MAAGGLEILNPGEGLMGELMQRLQRERTGGWSRSRDFAGTDEPSLF